MLTHLRISIFAILLLLYSFASAQATEKVLYSFGTNPNDGTVPNGDLVFDTAGNIYGTTQEGGAVCIEECGIVFELSPLPDGTWQETILYSFCSGGNTCPANPRAGLIMDSKGNLYGTTYRGGANDWGVVFELSPPTVPETNWNFTVLLQLGALIPGGGSEGRLTFDAAGNLYGTLSGGNISAGAVYELSPGPGGWTGKALFSFCSKFPHCPNGAVPMAGVTFDKAGNLYGTTSAGGPSGEGWGVIYELSPSGDGSWTEAVLHNFSAQNGGDPLGEVSFDNAGNLYTTAFEGGPGSPAECGGVFRLSPAQNGWKTGSFPFNDSGVNGCSPAAGVLVDDQRRTLYGTAESGSEYGGIVYGLSDKGQEIVYGFCQQTGCADGAVPNSTLTPRAGKLYGTTLSGGTASRCSGGCGVVYQIAP